MWNTNFFMITKCNFISGMIQYAYEESLRFSMHTRSHYDSVCIREVTEVCIQEVAGSNFGSEIVFYQICRGVPHTLQQPDWTVHQISSRLWS